MPHLQAPAFLPSDQVVLRSVRICVHLYNLCPSVSKRIPSPQGHEVIVIQQNVDEAFASPLCGIFSRLYRRFRPCCERRQLGAVTIKRRLLLKVLERFAQLCGARLAPENAVESGCYELLICAAMQSNCRTIAGRRRNRLI